jgi:hypothetical protein
MGKIPSGGAKEAKEAKEVSLAIDVVGLQAVTSHSRLSCLKEVLSTCYINT